VPLVSADTNNASAYVVDDVSSGEQQVTSLRDSVTMTSDDVDDDVTLASLLCVGAAVCVASLAVLAGLAARRRLRLAADKRVVVPASAARRLLAVTAAAAGAPATAAAGRECSLYAPPPPPATATLYSNKWMTTSHVSAMRLLFTGHTDTCSFVCRRRHRHHHRRQF